MKEKKSVISNPYLDPFVQIPVKTTVAYNDMEVTAGTQESRNEHIPVSTYFNLHSLGNVDWTVRIYDHHRSEAGFQNPTGVDIFVNGTTGLLCMIDALEFAAKTLKKQHKKKLKKKNKKMKQR